MKWICVYCKTEIDKLKGFDAEGRVIAECPKCKKEVLVKPLIRN